MHTFEYVSCFLAYLGIFYTTLVFYVFDYIFCCKLYSFFIVYYVIYFLVLMHKNLGSTNNIFMIRHWNIENAVGILCFILKVVLDEYLIWLETFSFSFQMVSYLKVSSLSLFLFVRFFISLTFSLLTLFIVNKE